MHSHVMAWELVCGKVALSQGQALRPHLHRSGTQGPQGYNLKKLFSPKTRKWQMALELYLPRGQERGQLSG